MDNPTLSAVRAGIVSGLPNATVEALKFEEASWATGFVSEDPFYRVRSDTATAAPGTLLSVEKDVNTSLYTLPPATALSRFTYQSRTLSNSSVPVSAFILWPYAPRSSADGYQVVAWAHGTSGLSAECAPSHFKNLWQHFLGPYQIALQGYVVVATDYAGLGIDQDASGRPIVHEYLAGPSHANDVFYSVQAARQAFPELSKHFVVVGHSQGGSAAWASAQRQAVEPVDGYLGAVAISPLTSITGQSEPFLSILGAAITPALDSFFPDFDPATILTSDGRQRLDLLTQVGGCSATALSLLSGADLLKPDWKQNPFVQEYEFRVRNGGKPISGALLVIHGEADAQPSPAVTTKAVEQTAEMFPQSQLEFILLPNVSHAPAILASQTVYGLDRRPLRW